MARQPASDQEVSVQEAHVSYMVKRKCEYPYGNIVNEGDIVTSSDEMNPDVFERIG